MNNKSQTPTPLSPAGATLRAFVLGTTATAIALIADSAVRELPWAPGWFALHALASGALVAFGVRLWVAGPLCATVPAAQPAAAGEAPAASVTTDALTRLPNRRAITGALLDQMAQAERYGHPLSVGLIEVANRKALSDALGPKAHDRAIETMAQVLSDTLRMPDKAGRYDTGTLLVVLPNTADKGAERIMQRLRTAVGKRVLARGAVRAKIDTRVRIAAYRRGEDLEQFLTRALLVEPRVVRRPARKA